jgi:hypothetical protein
MDLTEIYRVFHPGAAQYTYFAAAHVVQNISYFKTPSTPCIMPEPTE